jgi:deazaflavin-dependent oxidoreductase (nitroreductase family)
MVPDPAPASPRYVEPGWFTTRVVNPLANALSRRGVSLFGSRLLEVRGRRTGEWRSTTVNPLDLDGRRYLVAPRGETQWVRNLRVAGEGRLRIGRRTEPFTAVELTGEGKVVVLRAYLRRWKWEVGAFFDGVGPDASDEELLVAAGKHPVFVLEAGVGAR